MKTVHIELYSDFICPWCYLGKVRLEKVKQAITNEINLEIELKPYVLYPHIPKEGAPKSDFAKRTKPGMGRSLRHEAEAEGLSFNYKEIERIPYSLEAHRLVALVDDTGKAYELAKKIFHGYFEEANDIANLDYLSSLAREADINSEIIQKFNAGNAGEEVVRNAIQGAKEEFVSVVPSIKIDRKLMMPGLQTKQVWERYIRRAAAIQ